MPLPRPKRWILALVLVMLCLGGLLAVYLLLPYYLETRLLPRWAAAAGLDPQIIRLRRIGWHGTDTGPIRLNMGDLSFGQVDAIQIDYSPASLLLRRIDGIVLSGLNLTLTLNAAGDAIAGWEPPVQDAAARGPAIPVANLPQKVPVGLKRLALRNAMITVHWRGRSLEIPLELELDTSRLDQGRLHAKARLSPRGSPIHLTADLETGTNAVAVTVSAKEMEIARFSDLLALFADPPLAGRVALEAQARCQLQPLAVASMAGEARLSDMILPLAGGRLIHRGSPRAEATPIVIQWKSDDGRNVLWSLGPFGFQGPATLHVDGVAGRFTRQAQGWGAEALAHTILPVQAMTSGTAAPFSLLQPLATDLILSVRAEKGKTLAWELHTREIVGPTENRFCLQQADWQVESQAPRLEAMGEVDKGAILGRFQASVVELSAQSASASAKLPGFILDGAFQTSPEPAIQSTAALSGLDCRLGEATLTLPRIRLEAGLKKDGPGWAVTGELTVADGQAQYAPQDVRLGSIAVRLPVHYPLQPQPPVGEVAVGQMLWQSRPLGTLRGRIGLGSAGLWTELRHANTLLPGMNVKMRSELGSDGAFLTLTVPAFRPPAAVDLGRITPAAEGLLFQGRIEAQAEARAKGNAIQSRGHIRIDQGTLRHAGRQMALEGIACDLRLEDLIRLRSEPRQQLRVADLTLGKIGAQALSVAFQLEPPGTLFIEKAGMQWCKGSMQTQAFRLMPGRDEVEVTVYCDRINLAMLLDQLGAAQGSGDGAVNGRIPLLWKNGELRFDNGFLYSTPGQSGTIRLSGTQTLLEGLAPGTPQHTQLDIASEALKDYSYNWARVDLRSEGEFLLVSLKLDGKPNRLLPFAYDPQSGAFKRFSGQGQAEFQGINIDLNFKTPLREILHYRQMMAPKHK